MRVLIVDDSADYRALLKRRLSVAYPQALITVHDPETQAHPGPGFDWGRYDILFLDYQLGHSCERNGLDWLREFRGRPDFPVTIFLTGEGDEMVAVTALKLGAEDYIRKADLTSEMLTQSVDDALRFRPVAENTITAPELNETSITRTGPHASLPYSEAAIAAGEGVIDNYKIRKLLGKGGMAVVYLAEDITTGEEVAIKILKNAHTQDGTMIDRFIEEYTLLAELQHPNLVRIYAQGFTDDYVYIVMEYLSGGELRLVLRDREVSLQWVTGCIQHVAAALQVLHGKGIIHRDIKPGNIMFRADGSLALTDFGMAKRLDQDLDLTRHGEVLGTPYYMSPEQVQEQVLDERSDLYSLGIMFYEMLSGRRPFVARTAAALMYMHVYQNPDPIEGIPDKVNAVILKLMAKQPKDRYPSAEKLQLHLSTLY